MTLIFGISLLALIALLIFLPLARNLNWQNNVRQQQNIALYEQQMSYRPSPELASELGQRLLNDTAILQEIASNKPQSAVKNPLVLKTAIFFILLAIPLAYYFSMQRLDYVIQGEVAFQQKQQQLQNATTTEKNDDYITVVQRKLRENPNDGEAWIELGQAYVLSNEFSNALIAYSNAERLLGSKPQILGLAATALYYEAGQRMTEKARLLVENALSQDAKETASLSLLASDAFLNNEYAKAIGLWQQVLDSERTEVHRRRTIESIKTAEKLLKAQQMREAQ